MDDFIKNLKDRFSFDKVVSFMKDARLIEEQRDTPSSDSDDLVAGKSSPEMIEVDGAPIIINNVESRSETELEGSDSKNNITDNSDFNVLKKSSSHEDFLDSSHDSKSDPDSTKSEIPEKPIKKPVEVPLYL